MEELKKMLESITPELTKEDLDERFHQIAELLMKNYGIEANGEIYYLNEIEFYYDRKTIKRICEAGCWFRHKYGVDLTFKSNENEKYGGGILIRSIEKEIKSGIKENDFVTGPIKSVNEIWKPESAFVDFIPNPKIVRKERDVELNESSLRRNGQKNFQDENKWRFTIKDRKVS